MTNYSPTCLEFGITSKTVAIILRVKTGLSSGLETFPASVKVDLRICEYLH
eukprot:m.71019 g.71019  ORF g.71019 m.71019 type:complete len:51 (+) comp11690_c0_seq1:891-1043(+)